MSIRISEQASGGRSQNPPPEEDLAQQGATTLRQEVVQSGPAGPEATVLHGRQETAGLSLGWTQAPALNQSDPAPVEGSVPAGPMNLVMPSGGNAAVSSAANGGESSAAGNVAIAPAVLSALEAQPVGDGSMLGLIYRHDGAKVRVGGDAEDQARGTQEMRALPARWTVGPEKDGK